MSTFNLDGIQFTADNTSLGIAGKKTLKFGNTNNGDFADVETDGVEKFVNAVEIDWNRMQLGDGQVINTTGELASYISTASTAAVNAQNKANRAETDIININNKINNDLASISYVNSYVNSYVYESIGHAMAGTIDTIKLNGEVKIPENNEVDLGTVLTEIPAEYATKTYVESNYQPKGSYLSLTGGTIFDTPFGPDDDIYTYTKFEPNVIHLAYSYAEGGGVIANKMIEMTEDKINVQLTEYYEGTKDELPNPYSCVITPDDVVLKVDNAEVKKLSDACQGGATVTEEDTSKWDAATTTINNHSSDNSKHISDDERSAWNDKANSSELANYLPLTGGTIEKNYAGGMAPVSANTIEIYPDKIELTNGIDSAQKNVNITVDGISVKYSQAHITSGSSMSETTYCTITPDDVIIKNNDVVINGLSFLLNKITNLEKRIDALESKPGGTIKDPNQQVTSTKP